ncbi:hypothetical protein [Streptomyces marincola]|uniref:hypothetical protein n=1 Tax=Streptomyces marincola TaxID=2878388 RepID=UPI001CF266E7|nr:hypothetical protein [Streptomyces marincola]UCM88541.1 hypothetical protein LC193_11585 [Streptomyces marincola]
MTTPQPEPSGEADPEQGAAERELVNPSETIAERTAALLREAERLAAAVRDHLEGR